MDWTYKITLFLHVIFVATWFGGLSMMTIWTRKAMKGNPTQAQKVESLRSIHRVNLTMLIPSSVIALLTGFYLYFSIGLDPTPLWLLVKERFASIAILVYILFFTFFGKSLLKKASADTDQVDAGMKRYAMFLNISTLVLLIIIFFATTKIS
ncbi:CopD family protein [Mechercharimyces sp. CAU 1602]|uniref:CopD family protein n=1 Tax=Mechercharimyces sp. CAU 1602 TaxID=2973933 RepID=UPI002161B6E9|nr:CopD family protein [Mechercharimyces sp. CAU 1602]MCS1352150.1 CopD family protein [Mechercharimyces sp. CAU 1602]